MRKILSLVVAATLYALTATATTPTPIPIAQGPNSEHGFAAERAYQVGDIESVNLFNGDIVLTVPIGIRYPVNQFSYQLSLVYNSKVWAFYDKKPNRWYSTSDTTACTGTTCNSVLAVPDAESNAGIGWRLSLGQLYDGTEPWLLKGHQTAWNYVGPTGDSHTFVSTVSTNPTQTLVSADAAMLRLVNNGTNEKIVEFPNGERHTFQKFTGSLTWRLTQIADRHGNSLSVSYTIDSYDRDTAWTLTDSLGRSHVVTFALKTGMLRTASQGENVATIDMQAARAENGDPRRAVYTLNYDTTTTIAWPVGHALYVGTTPTPDRDGTNQPAMLTGISLPDGSAWSFSYQGALGSSDAEDGGGQGAIKTVMLPTRATTTYTYQGYSLPVGSLCALETEPVQLISPVGIKTKTVTVPGATTTTTTWKYIHAVGDDHRPAAGSADERSICQLCQAPQDVCPNPGVAWPGDIGPLSYWSRTTVMGPPAVAGGTWTRTDNYFNIWLAKGVNGDYAGPIGNPSGYGVPITNAAPAANLSLTTGPDVVNVTDGGSLSSRTFDGCDAYGNNCAQLRRTTYLGYAPMGWGELGRLATQLSSTRTVYNDDTGCNGACWTQTTSSDPNGAGQWKKTIFESNFPTGTPVSYAPRTETTDTTTYDSWSLSDLADPNRKWLPGKYTWRSHSEAGKTTYSYSCFDANTGFLNKVRTLACDTSDACTTFKANDLIAAFTSSGGLVAEAKYYGGDRQSVPETENCEVLNLTPEYFVKNTYSGGVLSKSQYMNGTSTILTARDLDIDSSTGLPTKSRDSAGIATTYVYDDKPARITSMTAPTTLTTAYDYTNATSDTSLAKVVATTGNAASPTLKSTWDFDGMGRVIKTTSLSPPDEDSGSSNINSIVEIGYDALGRRAKVSEPYKSGSTAHWTLFNYDIFGRLTQATMPDSKVSSVAYTGERERVRTTRVAILPSIALSTLTNDEGDVPVSETYDATGRLVRVVERSGPPNLQATTEYGYDFGGRLSSVQMTGSEGYSAQRRLFAYDRRGLLTYESHPENSDTSYSSFDSRGHAKYVLHGSAASVFDQELTYDGAERLLNLRARDPFNMSSFRDLKAWTYGAQGATSSVPGRAVNETLTSLISGKLVTATRWNYDPTETSENAGKVLKVTETYDYADATGRNTARRTKIERIWNGYTSTVRDVRFDMGYDSLGLRTSTAYPLCLNCTYATGAVQNSYAAGRLRSTSVTDGTTTTSVVDAIAYHPNGMFAKLEHSNGMDDRQTLATDGMARPAQITFGEFSKCTGPQISVSYSPMKSTYTSGEQVAFTLTANGTGTLTFQWWKDDGSGPPQVVSTSQSPTFTLLQTVTYWVVVTGTCGPRAESVRYTFTVTNCETASIVSSVPDLSPFSVNLLNGGSTTLSVTVQGTAPVNVKWYAGNVNDTTTWLADGLSLTVGPLYSSARYWVKVWADSCSTVTTRQFTVNVPLLAPTNLSATRNGTSISVGWTASPYAAKYRIERLSNGTWSQLAEQTGVGYTDSAVTLGSTYAYRVYALDASSGSISPYSNQDSATLMTFSTVSAGMAIDEAYFNEILAAVNSVRATAGLASLTWAHALPPGTTVAAQSGPILAEHLLTLRTRMAEALQIIGVPVRTITDPGLTRGYPIRAIYLTDLQHLVD